MTRTMSLYVSRKGRLETRLFWLKAAKQRTGCWVWQGRPSNAGPGFTGYGRLQLDGRTVYAHRVAWSLVHGPIPEGMNVCHRCDYPLCVNPDHLFLGTHRDNMVDMVAKGRHGQQAAARRRRSAA